MKRIILIISILLYTSICQAGGFVFDGPTTVSAGLTCKVSPGTETGGGWIDISNDGYWEGNGTLAQNWQYVQNAVSVSICQIDIQLTYVSSSPVVTMDICDTDCATNCTAAGATATVTAGTNWYSFTWATAVVKTGNFKVCYRTSGGGSQTRVSTAATYFGTSTTGENCSVGGTTHDEDTNMKIYYLQ